MYQVAYLIEPVGAANLPRFRRLLDARPGIRLDSVRLLGSGVIAAHVVPYQAGRLGPMLGRALYQDPDTSSAVKYSVAAVSLLEGGSRTRAGIARTVDSVTETVDRGIYSAGETVEAVKDAAVPFVIPGALLLVGGLLAARALRVI